MLGDGALTFREFAMREPLPLATIHDAFVRYPLAWFVQLTQPVALSRSVAAPTRLQNRA